MPFLIGQIALRVFILLCKAIFSKSTTRFRQDQSFEQPLSGVGMDGYPRNYTSHNIPLVVLSGLAKANASDGAEARYPLFQEKGIRIASEFPSILGPDAEELSECFREFDARDAAWNHRPSKGKMGTMSFTYRHVGRVGQNISSTATNLHPSLSHLSLLRVSYEPDCTSNCQSSPSFRLSIFN